MNLLLVALMAMTSGVEAQDGFARGVEAYEAGRFQEAFDRFSVALTDTDGAAVLRNLGNCAYRLGRPAEAVYYYRRALLRDPGSAELAFNLGLAEEQLGLDFGRDLTSTLARRAARVPLTTWVLLAGVLQTIGIVLWFWSRGRRRLRLVAGACLLVGVVAAAQASSVRWFSQAEGVILVQDVSVRSDPHTTVSPTFSLGAGETVVVLEYSDRWIDLRHRQGQGWTERSSVGLIE